MLKKGISSKFRPIRRMQHVAHDKTTLKVTRSTTDPVDYGLTISSTEDDVKTSLSKHGYI